MWDKVAREGQRDLEASPDGLLEQKARTGDRMALAGWRIRVTEWRYSKMEQWWWWLQNRLAVQLWSRSWRRVGIPE
ncbi:hypothetical protein NDU88_004714 [Pleurodeles waltl]|uniref:Uncharacterized protein n=1 Tax=Pleurodeles waltl TaxID=8319 RepID=A0AAV7NLT8_PLEWA|nr:hypothetical protein NDU88_004714 [Pleurodeles waltl]